jgi:predicted ATPase/class 3 adenylate cyclase
LTFLFTDIEGSTALLSALGNEFGSVIEAHSAIVRAAIATHGGTEVGTEGDAFFAVFTSPTEAVGAAVEAQRRLAAHPWPGETAVRVRMGLHTGEGRLGGDDYVGLDVHRAARIAAAGHGGQVLLSDATKILVAANLPAGAAIRGLGEHRLKDLRAPERIWQLDIDGLPTTFPALRSLDARPGSLPRAPNPLIGRTAAVGAIEHLVTTRPLVTLVGPGGTGKSRLALAVAERLASEVPDGAFFVALQEARERPAVAAAIAVALGVRERPDRDLEQGVREHLRDRSVLLVLDNFEQVMSAGPLVSELRAASPGLRILVTSRAVLHISGEQVYDVPPLELPRSQSAADPEGLARFEAIALFVERASAASPAFRLTGDNASAVAEICRRLDGLPLAVELAAARTRLLTPTAILERLDRSLPLLTGGPTDLPARQRTLRGAIEWSYDLLVAAERLLFERLSVFAGGWTIEAADAVCNPADELELETLDGLGSLLDESLILALPTGERDDDERRFGMLQVIREFAGERLGAGPDFDETRRRHAAHVMALAESAEPHLRASTLRTWQHRLRREQENVRAALRWAAEGGDVETGLRTAGAIWHYWHYWAELREGARWLDAFLAAPAAAKVPPRVRVKALRGLAGLLYWQGDADRSFSLYEEAVETARRIGDERLIGAALQDAAWGAIARGDLDGARGRAHESIDHYRVARDDDQVRIVTAWEAVAPIVTGQEGDTVAALESIREAVEINRRLGLGHEVADWLETRALLFRATGDFERAGEAGRESLRVWHALGTLGRYPLGLKILAAVEIGRGRPERAVRLGAAADLWNDKIGGEVPDVIAQLGNPVEEGRPFLEPAEHARAVAEGRGMGLEDQIAYALE